MATDTTVSKTILEQLGGRKFIVMTGATNLTGSDNALTMKIGRNAKSVSHVRITLVLDMYTMEFIRVRGTKITTVASHEMVYSDMLQSIFTKETGMYTSL